MRPREVRSAQVRASLGRWVDPAIAFRALFAGQTDVVWLDSGPDATDGLSVMGRATEAIVSTPATGAGAVLAALQADVGARTPEDADIPTDGFSLGWVGWIGYEARFDTMGVERTRESPYPDAAFLRLDRAIEFDHARRVVTLISSGDDAAWREDTVERLLAAGEHPVPGTVVRSTSTTGLVTWRDSDAAYLAKIDACQRAIHAGDAYLLCLTTEVTVEVQADPLETYLRLRASSPTHHGALLRIGEIALLSSSPERFLSVTPGGIVESRPIKGTRARGRSAEEDARLAHDLATSEKERAENLMIVDLMRNDIARVSRIGSVEVPSLLQVETYAPVHQLVSVVRGRLDEGMSGVDAVLACFPAGSMTGTPKSSATRILDRLEDAPRGIYSGAFGYFGFDGRVDLAMVIRSIVMTPGLATIGTGGGITALSVPEEELAEVKLKAAALLAALGA